MRFRGDVLRFELRPGADRPGSAWLRTNLGRAGVRREEVVAEAERGAPRLDRDWHDLPMLPREPGAFALALPLLETGVFEAKAYFLPEGSDEPVWPEGGNALVKVEPAGTCAANSIYTAFVRQFGRDGVDSAVEARAVRLEEAGYSVIPRSGTFRDLVRELDHVIDRLGFRIVALLPVHPVPTTYARMGRFGSPFAALDFTDVDPALAEFDRRTTPLDQFQELVDAVHARDARIFLDLPVNHTGWASWLQNHHPEWFAREEDRSFACPGAWGVTWEDLSKLDYRHRDLWKSVAEVFLFWCARGVDGFRLDAGYMVPFAVWEYVVARVRARFPDTVFLLEGLGGSLETTDDLLAKAGLDWAYSELFQSYSRDEIERELERSLRSAAESGLLVHFAETHDNLRLAATSREWSRHRCALAALTSVAGAFGITNGVEWFAREKLDVHGLSSLGWGAAENQVAQLARLNALLHGHPAFRGGAALRRVRRAGNEAVALLREAAGDGDRVLVLANPGFDGARRAAWDREDFSPPGDPVDLLTGRTVELEADGSRLGVTLGPGEVLCLSPAPYEPAPARGLPAACRDQELRAQALAAHDFLRGPGDVSDLDPDRLAADLRRDPRAFVAGRAGREAVVSLEWPRDEHRVVMLPPAHLLLVRAAHPFRADLADGDRVLARTRSLPGGDGGRFALLLPPPPPEAPRELALHVTAYGPEGVRRGRAPVLLLPAGDGATVRSAFDAGEAADRHAILTNGRGAYAQVRGAFSRIESRYDAVLAANPGPERPEDRRILLTRIRGWVVRRAWSRGIDGGCQERFAAEGPDTASWRFRVPCGMGKAVPLLLRLRLRAGRNAVDLEVRRPREDPGPDDLPPDEPVRVVLRPDVEDRIHHEVTKAFAGPETAWRSAVRPERRGFLFTPAAGRRLAVSLDGGSFTYEPEWTYNVPHPHERERGEESASDLLSPGWFEASLRAGERAVLRACALFGDDAAAPAATLPEPADPRDLPLAKALDRAVDSFVVTRDGSLTVIAGYPWFLDWGRDTLICLRGLAASGRIDAATEILLTFARFESRGTLPNTIRGADVSNRDTSDAPLWFLVAAADLLRAAGSDDLLDRDCGGRTLREVLVSVGSNYLAGTPNGIVADPETGLVMSPAHFTWMDTNHPAGTPREGYPVEIQALWHAGLGLLARIDPEGGWAGIAARVGASLRELYPRPEGWLSDCLHAGAGTPARDAVPDDHLRPNQLLAVTLGALRGDAARAIVRGCGELLVPGAIRSLADRAVEHPLPVRRAGVLLNDPARPYRGRYEGPEDMSRKVAYHNGTAWTWLFPSFCEALLLTEPARRDAARSLLASAVRVIDAGAVGTVPEILDGDAPHRPRGCGAQAWGVTEFRRVLALVDRPA